MNRRARKRRAYWVAELEKLSGRFGDDTARMIAELRAEIARDGIEALVDHLRVCGAVPEHYGHDSSAEKLYSKYTDAVISEAFGAFGLRSAIIVTRADAADVQARAKTYSLVADAKAFRLSRTAKNQKDFKVQALDGWRGGCDYAAVVCPVYQLPGRTSQIYLQAVARNVCILSYCHLATLVALSGKQSPRVAEAGFRAMLEKVSYLQPSKSAFDYWTGINGALLAALGRNAVLWTEEKKASLEGLDVVKEEALAYLRCERNRMLALTHEQALTELLQSAGLDSRIAQIERLQHGNLLGVPT